MSDIPLHNFRRSRQSRTGYTALPEEEYTSGCNQVDGDMPSATRAAAAATTSARNVHKALMRDHYEDDSEEATLLGGDEQRALEQEENLHAEISSQVCGVRTQLFLVSEFISEVHSVRKENSRKGQVAYSSFQTYRCASHWCTASGVSCHLT
jgi:hypothetical protein